jgi:hypothetical protein
VRLLRALLTMPASLLRPLLLVPLLLSLKLLSASRLLLLPALRLLVGVAKLGAAGDLAAPLGAEPPGLLAGAAAVLLLLLLLKLKASFSTSTMSARLSLVGPPGPVDCSLVIALACCVFPGLLLMGSTVM